MAQPSVPYQGFNASPTGIAETQTPNDYLNVRASPEAFGAQVGQAEQNIGVQGQKVGNEVVDLAFKYQGMINETKATNMFTDYMKQVGEKEAQFRSLEGMAAVDAAPKFVDEISKIRPMMGADQPLPVQTAFNTMAARREAYAIGDANLYVAQQIKQADLHSAQSSIGAHIASASDLSIARDDNRFNDLTQNIHFDQGRMMQNQGWDAGSGMQQNADGTHSFDESTPRGSNAKAIYDQMANKNLGEAWTNRIESLAQNDGVMAGYQKFLDNKDKIPPETQVKMEAWFKPKIRDGAADQYMNTLLAQAATDHQNAITGKSSGNPIDFVMQHEGGFVSNDSGKGPTNFGINQEANPDVDVKNITKEQAQQIIKTRYSDAIGADKMSPALASVAVDSAVNMGVAKTKAMLEQANGDPQKLIDLRRQEYNRLATENPDHYAKYLPAWNARLDDLQKTISVNPQQNANNPMPTSGYQTQADYMAANKDKLVANAQQWARENFPNDPTMENTVRERLNNTISSMTQAQAASYKQDNQTVMRAVAGDFSKGSPPATFAELRALPGLAPVLDRVAVQDDKFYGSIDGKIAQFARKNTTTNSANGYEAIQRVLDPEDSPNRISSQDHLDKLLGRSDGTGINMKDYQDAKKLIEASPQWRDYVSKNMKEVLSANGNVDGLGQQRALQWYGQASQIKDQNDAKGDKALPEKDLIDSINNLTKPPQPSRMEQISNWAKKVFSGNNAAAHPTQQQPQTATGANGEKYILQGGQWVKQ